MPEQQNRLTLLSLDADNASKETANRMNAFYHVVSEYISKKIEIKNARGHHAVVIGGGIMGILTAFYLQQEGFQITVIEKKSFGAAASGRNGGGILALGRELNEIPLVKVSLDLWEDLSFQGIDPHFVRSGHAMVAMNDLEAEKLAKAGQIYSQVGLETTFLSPKQAVNLVPDLNRDNKGALYSPIDCQGYPFLAISNLMEWLKGKGVSFINQCEVSGFEILNDRIRAVKTSGGTIVADHFILCTGPWTEQVGRLLDLPMPILPRRSQIMVTEIVGNRVIHPFVSGNALYLRQTHAGNILYGGGGNWEKTGFDVTNTTQAIHLLSTRLTELFPSYEKLLLIRAFAGTVEVAPDHYPFFGPIAHLQNAYVSAGYSGHGYGISAVFGKLLAKYMSSRINDIEVPNEIEQMTKDYSPSRFSNHDSLKQEGEGHDLR
jgi:sarcosine oxidase subunit beta